MNYLTQPGNNLGAWYTPWSWGIDVPLYFADLGYQEITNEDFEVVEQMKADALATGVELVAAVDTAGRVFLAPIDAVKQAAKDAGQKMIIFALFGLAGFTWLLRKRKRR